MALALALPAFVQAAGASDASEAEAAFRRSFSTATEDEWRTRLQPDEVNALCSRYRNSPPPEVAARIVELSQATLKLPTDAKAMLGDWRNGEKLASIGTGGQIGRIQPDRADTKRGGNCYACHTIAPGEIAAGNLGPSLTGYGKTRGSAPETVQFVYAKLYNAQAFYPCSTMPRFGHNQWLTAQEIADLVAFLLDPQSPANK
jgi:sulfur-oxidizing protein SoxX